MGMYGMMEGKQIIMPRFLGLFFRSIKPHVQMQLQTLWVGYGCLLLKICRVQVQNGLTYLAINMSYVF